MTDQKDKIIEILVKALYHKLGMDFTSEKHIQDDVRSITSGRYRNSQILQMLGFKWEPLPKQPTSDEQKSGVWIEDEYREIRISRADESWNPPSDGRTYFCHLGRWTRADRIGFDFWLAPPAPVKEPELDEFEKWAESELNSITENSAWYGGVRRALTKYREIKQQQGAH